MRTEIEEGDSIETSKPYHYKHTVGYFEGYLTIYMAHSNRPPHDRACIVFRPLEDDDQSFEIEMSPEDFAHVITGQGIKIEVRRVIKVETTPLSSEEAMNIRQKRRERAKGVG